MPDKSTIRFVLILAAVVVAVFTFIKPTETF